MYIYWGKESVQEEGFLNNQPIALRPNARRGKEGCGYICHFCGQRNEFPWRRSRMEQRWAWSDSHRRCLTRESNLGIISNAALLHRGNSADSRGRKTEKQMCAGSVERKIEKQENSPHLQ